jgi:hypothetical protein
MSDDFFDGSTIDRAIKPQPDTFTGGSKGIPPMERWPSPVQANQSSPMWSQSGRAAP